LHEHCGDNNVPQSSMLCINVDSDEETGIVKYHANLPCLLAWPIATRLDIL
jgi:hypothetical protein